MREIAWRLLHILRRPYTRSLYHLGGET